MRLLVFVKFSSWRGLVVVVLLDRGRNTCFFKATHKLQTCASGGVTFIFQMYDK